uniref:Glycosyltransferase family 28 N-terminal domain-containing protein n=1 Tax=Tetradesmus obliquus TaxID=3088 RepID=A0A383WES8_TETOB|eukprot:jgi/Sobl393_1/19393/SZX76115.1
MVGQQADKAELAEVHDVLAPRTPPLSPKLPAAAAVLKAEPVAGVAAASPTAAAELQGYRQVFQGKRVLIISGGTRGDVQPATALGVALAGLGARVCVAADAMFGGFVQQQGLAYRQLAGDARGMMALTVKWG